MLIKSVQSKLEKAGWTVTEERGRFAARKAGYHHEISFIRNGGGSQDAVCLKTRHLNDHDEFASDYFAGSYADSIKQALESVERYEKMDRVQEGGQQ